jgi:hypothetical protein
MTAPVKPDRLRSIGSTYNTDYFVDADDVIVVMPHVGLKDDAASARVNIKFQLDYQASTSRPCALVVVLTSLVSQDAEARRIYAEATDPSRFFATALVVGSPISRAIASFFLGLTKPKNPTRVVDSIESALAWVATQRPASNAQARAS